MGLDLYVMPMWRHLGGAFESPARALLGPDLRQLPAEREFLTPDDARRATQAFMAELSGICGREIVWSDEGEVALSVQMPWDSLHALRAYAAFQDDPAGGTYANHSPPEDHPSVERVYRGARTRFPHLILHSDYSGYYVPCELDAPILNPERGPTPSRLRRCLSRAWTWLHPRALRIKGALGFGSIFDRMKIGFYERFGEMAHKTKDYVPTDCTGSSVALLEELRRLGELLGMEQDPGQPASGETAAPEEDPLSGAKRGWTILHRVARVSVEQRLPVVFDG